jgi:polar amino acid transport system substrate-binding protein
MYRLEQRIWKTVFLWFAVFLGTTPSRADTNAPLVQVATTSCPPFVIVDGESFRGLSIFLWDEIARSLDLEYEIREYSLKGMVDAVANGQADVAVSCLSITREREEIVDFSHSFYETHLAIGAKDSSAAKAITGVFLSEQFLIAIGIVFGAAVFIGGAFYLLEHRENTKLYAMKTRAGKLIEAFIIGLLFVTRGPIRFYEFKTSVARVLAALLAVASTIMIASITAVLASAFTLDQLKSRVSGPQDLTHVRVGAVTASTGSRYLESRGIPHQVFDEREALLNALNNGRLDAVVSDEAVLNYTIKQGKEQGRYESLIVLPHNFEKQNYGLALRDESPYIELLNQTLLAARKSPAWKDELARYLGESGTQSLLR